MSRRNRHAFDEPSIVLSGGPSFSRSADDDDLPYVAPTQPIGFPRGPQRVYLVEHVDGVPRPFEVGDAVSVTTIDLADPAEPEPLLWDGDQA